MKFHGNMFSPDKQPLVNWPVEGGGQSSASKCAPHRQSGGSERDAVRKTQASRQHEI